MTDQNKKGPSQGGKKNTEKEQIQVYLEASLGINVSNFKLLEEVNKNNTCGEGFKNKVFIHQQSNNYLFRLGHFDLDWIPPFLKTENANPVNSSNVVKQNDYLNNPDDKQNKSSKTDILQYKLNFATANLQNAMDKTGFDVINSSNPNINPFINVSNEFKYSIAISSTASSNNRVSPLKAISFDIITPIKCCNCDAEETQENPLYFCWTDKKYFCSQCDKMWHEQKEKKSLGYHYRTRKYKYTLSYYGNCEVHNGRPYQYFDEKNKVCLCVKCLESLNSNERESPNIHFIEEYLETKKRDEDFQNSKIDAICEELKSRIEYAEGVWDKIDKYEKKYNEELEFKRADTLNRMRDEGFARSTFLSCLFMEIQRIIKEIDSKVIFNKNQKNNVDVSTFLYLNQIYTSYMSKELIKVLDNLANTNLENFIKPIINVVNGEIDAFPIINIEDQKLKENPFLKNKYI